MAEEVVVIKEMLTKEMIDAGDKLLQRLDEAKLNVQAALWVYLPILNAWWLVFALPGVREEGPLKSYQKIHTVLSQIPGDQLSGDLTNISVVKTDDRFISMLRQSKPVVPLRSRVYIPEGKIHGRYVEEAYIYRLK